MYFVLQSIKKCKKKIKKERKFFFFVLQVSIKYINAIYEIEKKIIKECKKNTCASFHV